MAYISLSEYFGTGFPSYPSFADCVRTRGVQRFALTIISGRCGSTWLGEICALYGFGVGAEKLGEYDQSELESLEPLRSFHDFFSRILADGSCAGHYYFKSTASRLRDLFKLIGSEYLRDFGIDVTLLCRRNVFSQALSFYNATNSGVWHAKVDEAGTRTGAGTNPKAVLEWTRAILAQEIEAGEIAALLSDREPGIFYYEDLVAAPLETVSSFLDYHGERIDLVHLESAIRNSSYRKIERPEFAQQYAAIEELLPNRDTLVRMRNQVGSYYPANVELSEEVARAIDRYSNAPT